jgi:hypothetical protein
LEEKIRHHDKEFVFPSADSTLSADDVRAHLNNATKTLRKIQLGADGYRTSSLYDLLAMYKSGSSPYTSDEDRRRASIVRRTIQTEASRDFFGHLRSQLKPTDCTGLFYYANIPVHDEMESTHYQYLQVPHDSIIWQKVIDTETIERHALDYNSESFRVTSLSPGGSGIIHYHDLIFTSLSPSARDIQKGHLPPTWNVTDPTLQDSSHHLVFSPKVLDSPPISTELTACDIVKGFSRGKETTATCPSGRH